LGRKNQNSAKTVNDLPLGQGKGTVATRMSRTLIRVVGKVVVKNGKKHLIAFKGNPKEPKGVTKRSFAAGTKVLKWQNT